MTPERIAEFRDAIANHPHFGIGGDALSKILDALEATQAEIADLKRGGVVVPELLAETTLALIAIDWPNRTIDIIATARNIREWFRNSARTIPADRVLGEEEARIGMNELQMLRCFAGRRMSEREYDRLEAVRDAHEEALRAQPAQEPTT